MRLLSRLKPLLLCFILAGIALYLAQRVPGNTNLQGFLVNLSADGIVIGLTLAIIDPWSRHKSQAEYAELESYAISRVQRQVFMQINSSVFELVTKEEEIGTGIYQSKLKFPNSIKAGSDAWVDFTYKRDIDELGLIDFLKCTESQAARILKYGEMAKDAVAKAMADYQNTLRPQTFTAMHTIHITLNLMSYGYMATLLNVRGPDLRERPMLRNQEVDWFKRTIATLLKAGKLTRELDELKQ